MKKRKRFLAACFCSLLLVLLPDVLVSADRAPSLRFQWQAGKRYTMSLEISKQLVVENLPPSANKGSENEKREIAISVYNANQKENCELVVECLSTKAESKGTVPYSFNSTTDPKNDAGIPLAAMYRAFIGTRIKYLLGPDYKVLRVEGTDELVRKMIAHDPGLHDDTSTPFLTEAKFGTNALTELLHDMMVIGLPKGEIKVGDQWRYPTERRTELTIAESIFTFVSLERHSGHDSAQIKIEGAIKSSSDRGELPPEIPIPNVHGQVKGTIWLDAKLGMLVEKNTLEETKTIMEPPAVHGKAGATVTMNINQKRTVICKLIKVENF